MKHADKLETLSIDSLVPYARNARTGQRAVRESDGMEFPA